MQPAPQVDHLVPNFQVQDVKGKPLSPDSLLGQPYVLYFYPKNDTPGCTAEACQFRDTQVDFEKIQALVIGISPDTRLSHQKFAAKYGLNFSLVADPSHELCTLFQVWEEKKVFGQTHWGVTRTTFVVDAKGIIRWIEKPVQVEGHSQRVLEALKNLPKASSPL